MSKKQFKFGIDHAMMTGAKTAFNTCLQTAVTKAISSGSDEGSATLRLSFDIATVMDKEAGEVKHLPVFKYKAGYSVPMKESMDATIAENSRLESTKDGWMLVNGQVSMDELMDGDGE